MPGFSNEIKQLEADRVQSLLQLSLILYHSPDFITYTKI